MNVSPAKLMAEMAKVDQLRQLVGADADPQLLLDTIEGETDALECVDALIEAILADQQLIGVASLRIDRIEARAEKRRATLLQVLEQKLRQRKLERPLATVWVSTSTAQPRVTDQTKLPEQYLRLAVDTQKLGAALRRGERIDGAELSNSRSVLNVRGT